MPTFASSRAPCRRSCGVLNLRRLTLPLCLVLAAGPGGCTNSVPVRPPDAGEKPTSKRGDAYFVAARIAHDRALELDPYSPERRLEVSRCANSVRAALEVDPLAPHLLSTMGDLCLELDEAAEAEDWYLLSQQASRNWPPAYLGLAQCFAQSGRADEAQRMLVHAEQAARFLGEGREGVGQVRLASPKKLPPLERGASGGWDESERRDHLVELLGRVTMWSADQEPSTASLCVLGKTELMNRVMAQIALVKGELRADGPSDAAILASLRWSPDYYPAVIASACSKLARGEYSGAAAEVEPFVLAPNSKLSRNFEPIYVKCQAAAGEYLRTGTPTVAQGALVALNDACGLFPSNPELFLLRAQMEIGLAHRQAQPGMLEHAARDLDHAERCIPSRDGSARASDLRGRLAQRRSEWERAKAAGAAAASPKG